MTGIPPRDETVVRLHDIVHDKVMSVLRGPESKPFDLLLDYLDRYNRELDAPLRMSATIPDSSRLLIKSNQLIAGDGGRKTIPPIDDVLNLFPDTSIDFDGGAVSGGGSVTTQGGSFALPGTPAGQFVRMAAVYQSTTNSVDTLFSDAAATSGSLANPGDLFSQLDGLPIGYADLENVAVSSFKSIGSVSGFIENSVDDIPMISRFAAGGGVGGGAIDDFKIKSVTGSTVLIGKGYQKLTSDLSLVTGSGTSNADLPADLSLNLDTILGSSPVANTTYYLYVDMQNLESEFSLSDTGFKVIRVMSETDFALLTTQPVDTNSLRYLPVGHIHTADDASWDGAESVNFTTPVLRQSLDQQFFSSVEKTEDSVSSATTKTFSHGLSGKPQIIEFFYFDGSNETSVDASAHLLNVTDSDVEYSSTGLTFGSGEILRLNAFYVKPPSSSLASAQGQAEFGWFTDSSTTVFAHNLSNALDIKGLSVLEHDVSNDEYRILDSSMLISRFDDDNIYLDWMGLSPSTTLRYRIITGGQPLPASIPVQFGGFNKFVGFGPGSFATVTVALATASAGDSILVNKTYKISAEETINVDDIKIKFMPGVEVSQSSGSVGWRVTGSRVDIDGFALEANFSGTLTDVLRIEGDDCYLRNVKIRSNNAGMTITNAVNIVAGADKNYVRGTVIVDSGAVTNGLVDNGAATDAAIRNGSRVFVSNNVTSEITLDTGNGRGSTNTAVRRFTNAVIVGVAMTHASSASDGDSITINEDGIYSITYSDRITAGAGLFGISKNASLLAGASGRINNLSANERLTSNAVNTNLGSCSATRRLLAGDVVRPHTDEFGNESATAEVQFSICQVNRI